jgi:ubiquinone/menaquinone biosynthesis C-methylase UbiE
VSAVHAGGPDLDRVIGLCEPRAGLEVVDVATGGGHVARRLRELGAKVTTVDPSEAMEPDVVATAESLPFEAGSFDVVVNRLAAHHFTSIEDAVSEFGRVTRGSVVIEDHLRTDDDTEAAEKLRDPSHVRSRDEAEWRALLEGVGLEVDHVSFHDMTLDFDSWFERTQTPPADAARARELLAPRTTGETWSSPMIIIRARKR